MIVLMASCALAMGAAVLLRPLRFTSHQEEIAYVLRHRSVALNPSIDGPSPGIATRRLSHRQGCWNRKGQQSSQSWKPTIFLFDLHRIVGGARQAHNHVLAQVKDSVVPPADLDRPDREVRPLRKLSGHQAAYKRVVYNRLCHVHLVASDEKRDTRIHLLLAGAAAADYARARQSLGSQPVRYLNCIPCFWAISFNCSRVSCFGGAPGALDTSRKNASTPGGATTQSSNSSLSGFSTPCQTPVGT